MAKPDEPRATRRDVLKAAGAVVAGQFVQVRAAAAPASPPAFFTAEEFTLVDELTELILPADEHSPGARAAQAAAYIDQQLHETLLDEVKAQWRDGLQRIEALSRQMHGADFLKASPEQRVAVLARIAENEENPETPEEQFFAELKSRTAFAYYTSKIGIHTEMEYKGNVYQEELAGYDAEPLGRE
jgi:hypothetical protein